MATFMVGSISLFYRKKTIYVNIGSLFLFLILLLMFVHFAIKGNEYGTTWIYTVLCSLVLFFALKNIFYQNPLFLKSVLLFIVIGLGIELIIGIGQMNLLLKNENSNFLMGGTMGNPGAYANYLSVIVPFLLSVIWKLRYNKKVENIYYILLGCIIISIFLIAMSQSRAAWIACTLACLLIVNKYSGLWNKVKYHIDSPVKKVATFLCLSISSIIIFYILYNYKSESAFGRLLIWKITILASHSHWLVGNGSGYFEANYGHWQEAYFSTGGDTKLEYYVADYVTCAYNEFIQIFVEQGFLGLMLLITLILAAFKRKNLSHSILVTGSKASLVSICILMCVSYPLQMRLIYFYFIVFLAIIFCEPQKNDCLLSKKVTNGLRCLYPILCLYILWNACCNLYGLFLMRKGQTSVFTNDIKGGLECYQQAYPFLENNGIFLFYYSSALSLNKQYVLAIRELEKAVKKTSNPSCYILLGDNYKEIQEYKKAESVYLKAVHALPSKLYPKYLLVKLYRESSQYEKAFNVADEIIQMPEKVKTMLGKEIKEEMIHLVNNKCLIFKRDSLWKRKH
ncbi:O-antigen ligase family protein [Phocaeicola sartorii]|uniref:O-antigen ligase family protein n=1 Tax=Phocaeicola sartorii TaxID=671267 RepID=UPI003512283E